MKKLGVALVICLLLALFVGAQAASALTAPTMTKPGNLFDMSKQKALLKNIEQKLATGNTGNIAAEQKLMDQKTVQSANKIYADTTDTLNAKMTKPTATVKAPKSTITKPMTNLQDTAKSLEHLNFAAPSLKKAFLNVY